MNSVADRQVDFAVIGGGAAGFFGAIAFAESAPGATACILEKTNRVLEKVRISGGGRCNVTHDCFDPKELTESYPRGGKSLIGPFHRWGVADTVDWFEGRGVALKTESDGRMFPVTDDSETIRRALESAADDLGVEVLLDHGVEEIRREAECWRIRLSDDSELQARNVLLASGGIRNQTGALLAGELGHSVIPAAPSLFTFKIADPKIEGLSGLSADSVTIRVPGTKLSSAGPCLVTHWGLSGPAVLKLSAWGAHELADTGYRFGIEINWCGGASEEGLVQRCQLAREEVGKRFVRTGLEAIPLPSRLWQSLVRAAGIDDETTWSNLSKAARSRLIRQLTTCSFDVDGKSMNKEEFVTAGGVELREVDIRTMESRLHPGLYFAGEVLNIDGVTGGFNFQAAWTTGRIAGESAAATVSG